MTEPGAWLGAAGQGTPPCVLVVARPALVRMLAVKALESQGCRALEVDDPAAATATYARVRPTGVLLDLAQAEEAGLDALRAIRRDDPVARVAVITARADRVLVLAVMQAGACDLVVKPVPAARLARLMHTLVAPPRERRHPRVTVALRGEIAVGDGRAWPCVIEDISPGGARCALGDATADRLAPGTAVQLTVALPDEATPIQAYGQVVRVIGPGLVGLSVIQMTEAHADRLAAFCRRAGQALPGRVADRRASALPNH